MFKKFLLVVLLFSIIGTNVFGFEILFEEIETAKPDPNDRVSQYMYSDGQSKIYEIYLIDNDKKLLIDKQILHKSFPIDFNREPFVQLRYRDCNLDNVPDYLIFFSNGGRMFPGTLVIVDGKTDNIIFDYAKLRYKIHFDNRKFIVENGKITEILTETGQLVKRSIYYWNKEKNKFE